MKRVEITLFSLFFLLVAVASATTYPYTVTDDLGREVTLTAPPERIVTMMPSHTETVCALGACGSIVGVDEASNYPIEVNDLPQLGNAFAPNVEAIVALEPDLVLVDEWSGLAESLSALGLTVYAGTPQTYAEVFDMFALTGRLLDRETEAALLAGRSRGTIGSISKLTSTATVPSVYFEIDATPYSVGPGSFIGELLTKAGGRTIVEAGQGDYPQLDPEFVIAADPEVVILADAPFGESVETLAARPGWDGLSALSTNRVVPLTSEQVDIVNRPGPRIVEAVELLAHLLHPGLLD